MADYFTYSDIEYVCVEAARKAVRKQSIITTNILGSIIANYQPVLNESKIQDYL